MSDDDFELRRLFAEADGMVADEMFVARVQARLGRRKHMALAALAAAVAVLLAALWATWPAAYAFSNATLEGMAFITAGARLMLASQTGQLAAGALVVAAMLWLWLYERLRGVTG